MVLSLYGVIGTVRAEERVFEVAIADAATRPPSVLSVRENDTVVIRLRCDQRVQVHLHGYDIESDVRPNAVTTLRLRATATGRFPMEIHSHQSRARPFAYLEVLPR